NSTIPRKDPSSLGSSNLLSFVEKNRKCSSNFPKKLKPLPMLPYPTSKKTSTNKSISNRKKSSSKNSKTLLVRHPISMSFLSSPNSNRSVTIPLSLKAMSTTINTTPQASGSSSLNYSKRLARVAKNSSSSLNI